MDNVEIVERAEKQSWKAFIKLILKSKLPWHLYILAFIATIATTRITLQLPMMMGEIYSGSVFDDPSIMYKLVYLTALSVVGYTISSTLYTWAGARTPRNIRNTLWSKIIRMPMNYYNKQPSLQLVSRVTNDPLFIDAVVSDTFLIINTAYAFIGSIVIMYSMSTKLTLTLLPTIPYMVIISFVVGHFSQKAQNKVQTRYSGLTAYFAERLPKIRLVKMFTKEEDEMAYADAVIEEQYKAERYKAMVELFAEPLMQSTQAITTAIVLIYGGLLASRGEIEVGQIISFYLYSDRIFDSLLRFGQYINTVKVAKGASEKISEVLDGEDELLTRKESFNAVLERENGDIRLENVTFAYDEKPILKNLDITIPERKVTAIIGPSGGGKTTIFNILERFYEPNAGKVMLGDTPAEDINLNDWREKFGYVSQNSPILSGTIRDNILYGVRRDVTDEEVEVAASLADALEFISRFPDGLDTEVGENGSKLSGGQRQRVALARAFIIDPEYLLLDEATSSLDSTSELNVQEGLDVLMEGRTTIVIAHNLTTITRADQIIVLDDGEIKAVGSHNSLMKEDGLYRDLIRIQMEKDQKLIGAES